jgi:hypothetical protein
MSDVEVGGGREGDAIGRRLPPATRIFARRARLRQQWLSSLHLQSRCREGSTCRQWATKPSSPRLMAPCLTPAGKLKFYELSRGESGNELLNWSTCAGSLPQECCGGAADRRLEGVKFSHACSGLRRSWRVGALISVTERALCIDPARRQLDFAAGNEALEPGIQMRSRTPAPPIRTVQIETAGGSGTLHRLSIVAVDAEPASLGPPTTAMEHGARRIIDK